MADSVRAAFFDSEKVLSAADKAEQKVLSKFGAFVRRRARSSIRKRKKPSEVGKPPSSHAGQLKLIFFACDRVRKTVVVGPALFASRTGGAGKVPGLMERGGTSIRNRKTMGPKTLRYRSRPFMAPALAAETPKFADQLRGMMGK